MCALRAVFLNSPVSLCLLPVILRSRTNETIFHSPYTLPSSVSCKSCICHSYENCRGVHQQFPFWFTPSATERNSLLITGHLHSTPFLSRRCALFCTLQNSTLFFSSDCALFVQKHPGGVPLSFQVTHIWYSGRPKMIARRPLLAQNITRKRKSTP